MLAFLDQLLRRGDEWSDALQDPVQCRRFARSALLWVILLGGFYGAVMGAYQLFREGSPWNALTSMLKVPALLLVTTGICFPALYVFGIAGGARLRASSLWAALLGALVVLGILLAALSPIVFFFLSTVNSYLIVKFMHVAVWAVAGLGGLKFLRGVLKRLDPSLTKNVKLMASWTLLFGLVGMQSAWMLRPFIGRPNQPFAAFQRIGGNIFEDLVQSARRAARPKKQKEREREQQQRESDQMERRYG